MWAPIRLDLNGSLAVPWDEEGDVDIDQASFFRGLK
jgi:hypothetical protein